MTVSIARQVVAVGDDASSIARHIVDELAAPDLRLVFVFADWKIDPQILASVTYRGLRAPVVGGTTIGAVGPGVLPGMVGAVALGLYGDWLRVGLGVASELPKAALARSRDAVNDAAVALGRRSDKLEGARNVGVTIFDGTCGHEEAFCIGSAAAAPQIRVVGGGTATGDRAGRSLLWINGEVMRDAGVVVLLESELPFHALSSAHLVPTDRKTVVTGASGRVIYELDGQPAASRVRALVASMGDTLDEPEPSHTFARFIDGHPYVRSMMRVEGEHVHLASAVEAGHILRLMRPGDLIGTTRRDLVTARDRVGGRLGALLAFSCLARHREASLRGLARSLASVYHAQDAVGFQSLGEQSSMLLVNHTLTGLAIGAPR